MFSKRNPSQEEISEQYKALVEKLAEFGLKPEDVPAAMAQLRYEILAECAKIPDRQHRQLA